MTDNEYRSTASTIDIVFSGTDNHETDYVKIARHKKDDIKIYKQHYNQIYNSVNTAKERINLIADFIENKINTPLQGILFE
jgi:hypothetical protein